VRAWIGDGMDDPDGVLGIDGISGVFDVERAGRFSETSGGAEGDSC
jgi:hypothetical protein